MSPTSGSNNRPLMAPPTAPRRAPHAHRTTPEHVQPGLIDPHSKSPTTQGLSDLSARLLPMKHPTHSLTQLAVMAVVALAVLSAPSARGNPETTTATVLRVVDGDTIDIRDDVRGRLRVRILGIDTPETKKPGYTVGCWGPEATEFAKSNMSGQRIALQPDPTQDRADRYGRTLAYLVKADGWNYSVEAVRAGAAKSYVYHNKPVTEYPAITAAEQEAIAAKRGLWGAPCFGTTDSIPR